MTSIITAEQKFHSDFSKNLNSLEVTRKKVNAQINDALRKGDDVSLKVYTNLYLLIYSAWTEASLIRLVHTPFGFTLDEKRIILSDRDVINKWKKCINSAFSKFESKGSDVPNKKQQIHKLINNYLKTQAQVRNKIAHGQWEFPLHKNNITFDAESQTVISLIDVIQIDTWFEIFKEIVEIVRGLIDSRKKNNYMAHYDHYFNRLVNIQRIIDERKGWTLSDKKRRLKLKARR